MSRCCLLRQKVLSAWRCLRFSDIDSETAFKRHLEESLIVSSLVYMVATLFLDFLLNVAFGMGTIAPVVYIGFGTPEEFLATCYTAIAVMMICLLVSGILRLKLEALLWMDWEIAIILLFSFAIVMHPWRSSWTTATLYGLDPNKYWKSVEIDNDMVIQFPIFNDGGVQALLVDIEVTALCLFIPVRLCLKWIPIALGITFFFLSGIFVGSTHPLNFWQNGCFLAFLVFFAFWGAYSNERTSRDEFLSQRLLDRKSHELQMTHESHSRILHRLTDAIVYLGSDFTIMDSDSRFPAIVGRSCKNMITGCNFCNFLPAEEDCTRFKNALLRSREAVSDPEAHREQDMVQVHLCDRYNSRFGVYAYNAGIFGSVSGLCHTVAIVEAGERDTFGAEQIVPHLVPLEVQPEFTNSVPSEDSASNSDTQTSGSSILVESRNDLAVWVNLRSPELSIEQCSVEFTMFGPTLEGGGLQQYLQFDGGVDMWSTFVSWVHDSIEDVLDMSDHGSSMRDHLLQDVRICNPSHSPLVFSAKCYLDIDSPLPPSLQTRSDLVRLVFDEVKRVKKKRRRKRVRSEVRRCIPNQPFGMRVLKL